MFFSSHCLTAQLTLSTVFGSMMANQEQLCIRFSPPTPASLPPILSTLAVSPISSSNSRSNGTQAWACNESQASGSARSLQVYLWLAARAAIRCSHRLPELSCAIGTGLSCAVATPQSPLGLDKTTLIQSCCRILDILFMIAIVTGKMIITTTFKQ